MKDRISAFFLAVDQLTMPPMDIIRFALEGMQLHRLYYGQVKFQVRQMIISFQCLKNYLPSQTPNFLRG